MILDGILFVIKRIKRTSLPEILYSKWLKPLNSRYQSLPFPDVKDIV